MISPAPTRRRLVSVLRAALPRLAVPAVQLAVSAFVVRHFSLEVWGELASFALAVGLLAHLPAMGSRDALLAAWARESTEVGADFAGAVLVRLPWLGFALGIVGCWAVVGHLEASVATALAAWLVAQTAWLWLEALVVVRRAFVAAAVAEVVGAAVCLALVAWLPVGHLVWALAVGALTRVAVVALSCRDDLGQPPRRRVGLRMGLPFFATAAVGALQARAELYLAALIAPPSLLGALQLVGTVGGLLRTAGHTLNEPFVTGLMRLSWASTRRLFVARLLAALLIVPPGLLGGAVLLWLLHGVVVEPLAWAGLGLGAAASFGLSPWVYGLLGRGRRWIIVWASAVGALITAGLTLLPAEPAVVTFVWAGAAGQGVVLLLLWRQSATLANRTPLL